MNIKIYKINSNYEKNKKNRNKILLTDNNIDFIAFIDIYCIKNKFFIDIKSDSNQKMLTGQRINISNDILFFIKNKTHNFPKISMYVLSENKTAFKKEFDVETAGILQNIFIIAEEEQKK